MKFLDHIEQKFLRNEAEPLGPTTAIRKVDDSQIMKSQPHLQRYEFSVGVGCTTPIRPKVGAMAMEVEIAHACNEARKIIAHHIYGEAIQDLDELSRMIYKTSGSRSDEYIAVIKLIEKCRSL